MERPSLWLVFKRLFFSEIVIVGGVLAVCLLAGWRSTSEITRVLKVVGVVMMLVATSGVIGHNAAPRRFDYLAPRTARQDALRYERGVRIFRQRTVDEKVRSIFHQALVVGGLVVMIALVIDAVFA